ncbi:hypothetical protein [Heyndrickxia faecalis]
MQTSMLMINPTGGRANEALRQIELRELAPVFGDAKMQKSGMAPLF